MKSTAVFLIFSILLTTALSFNHTRKGYKFSDGFIHRSLTNFRNELLLLKEDAIQFEKGNISAEQMKASVANARLAYKQIEFYIAYHYPEFVKTKLNGAPLYRLEAAGTTAYTLPPEGLQVLDELVNAPEPEKSSTQILETVDFLTNNFNSFYMSAIRNGLSTGPNKVLPLRIQLIRIYSLGVTGFDTPGSQNITEEAKYSFIGMKGYLNEDPYFKNFKTQRANVLFDNAIVYLAKNRDFNTFDRIDFYKKIIRPLYQELASLDGREDELQDLSGWNPANTEFFKSNFLNPYFYTLLRKEEDSKQLQALGRQLFFDPALSSSGTMSCATCHSPEKGFADAKAKSPSRIEGKTVLRNSPTIYNAVFAKRFFYDLRAFYLEQQAEHVIYNEQEFNTSYENIAAKLGKKKSYRKSFRTLFRDGKINRENFSAALSSYVASQHSFDSDFDKFMRDEKDINPDAKRGFNLFMGKAKCATCHFIPTFSGLVPPFYNENESEVLGVSRNPSSPGPLLMDGDQGRYGSPVGKESSWIYQNSFKTVTVRNSWITAPYFHNGSFSTLEEVMDFYNEGGGQGLGLTVSNQTLSADKLNLTEGEKNDIIAFLKSLTDISRAKY